MQELLALASESGGAIGHDTLTLSGSDLATQVSLARLAELALLAFRCAESDALVEKNDDGIANAAGVVQGRLTY